MKDNKTSRFAIIPVMMCFFVMGFVDLVGATTNLFQADKGLSDKVANFLPSLVFIWFLIFSIPTGMLMNKIGRKKTVILSLVVTALSLMFPLFGENLTMMLISFSLLGIGNTLLQVSLNPLVVTVVKGGDMASTITLGQFVKAIASLLAPLITAWGAQSALLSSGLSWRILFPIYLVIGLVTLLLLASTSIMEEPLHDKPSTFTECVSLLRVPIVLLSFIGIICHVGIDVGVNTIAPRVFSECLNVPIKGAVITTSIYFAFRLIGSLTGSFFLRVMNHRSFFLISVAMLLTGMACMLAALFFGHANTATQWLLFAALAILGYGNSNIFSLVISQAFISLPEKQNEVSGLMIMGLFGGFLFPFIMGFASDAVGNQSGAIIVMLFAVAYLFSYAKKINQ
jgi:fucose permease